MRANRLESRCFGDRDGETPGPTRDSNEFKRRAVRAICLAASEQGKSRTRDATELSRDLQLHFALALPGLPVEGAPDREGSPRPCGDPLHASIAPFGAGKRMAVLMPSSKARCASFDKTIAWTLPSFTAMARPLRPRKAAITSASAGTRGSAGNQKSATSQAKQLICVQNRLLGRAAERFAAYPADNLSAG